jgi:hypothetical protein
LACPALEGAKGREVLTARAIKPDRVLIIFITSIEVFASAA